MRKVEVALFGNGGAGKSMITSQFINGVECEMHDPTFADSHTKLWKDQNGDDVMLHIHDIGGIEELLCIHREYYTTIDAAILVYSSRETESLQWIRGHARAILTGNGCEYFPMVVVRNRLASHAPGEQQREEGKRFAGSIGAEFTEVCAISGDGVDEIFDTIVRLAVANGLTPRDRRVSEYWRGTARSRRITFGMCALLCSPLPMELVSYIAENVDWASKPEERTGKQKRKKQYKCGVQ